jgi:hypothetical protein
MISFFTLASPSSSAQLRPTRPAVIAALAALWTHGRTGHAAQHRQLSNMRQRIGERTLDQLLDRSFELSVSGKCRIKRGEAGKEALDLGLPVIAAAGLPFLAAAGHRDAPAH